MRKLTLAAIAAATLCAGTGAALAGGTSAGGPYGEALRRDGVPSFYNAPVYGAPVIVDDEPEYTGTIVDRPGYLTGTPPNGVGGSSAGGPRGEWERRNGIGR